MLLMHDLNIACAAQCDSDEPNEKSFSLGCLMNMSSFVAARIP
jgi:hypothetical protein